MILPRIKLINKRPILININYKNYPLVNKIYKYYLQYQNTTFSFYNKKDLKDFLINQYYQGLINNLGNLEVKCNVSKSWISKLINSKVSDHFEITYF